LNDVKSVKIEGGNSPKTLGLFPETIPAHEAWEFGAKLHHNLATSVSV